MMNRKKIVSALCIFSILLSLIASIALPAAAAEPIVNLFDVTKANNDVYYGDTNIQSSSSWTTSEYIPIQNGDVITFGPADSGQGYHLVLTNANKTVLTRPSAAACTKKETVSGNYGIYSYTINNASATYLRISTPTAQKNELLVTKNRPFTNAERLAYFAGEIVNLFDADKATYEVYYNNNGASANNAYLSTDYIPAQNGDTITFGAMGDQGYHLVLLDSNKTVIARPKGNVKEALSGGLNIYEYTINTANVAYIRVTIQLSLGTNLPDTFLLTKNRPFTNAERLAYFAGESEEPEIPTEPSHLINRYDFFQSQGNVVHNSATPSTVAGFSTSRAIKVEAGETIYMGPCDPNQSYHLAYFSGEAESTWLGRIVKNDSRLTTVETRADGYVIYSFTVPENVNYLRVPVANAVADEFILTRNQPFSEKDRAAYFAYSPLWEKAALFVGDSITDGTQDSVYGRWHGWAYRIGTAFDMTWVNKGLSGTSISTARKQTFGTIVDQMLTQKDSDFDYVILHGGVNDAWSQAPVGEVTASFDPSTFDVTTFAGGLEDLIYNALYHFGDQAAIGYIMNFPTPNYQGTTNVHNMSAYYAVAEKVCNKWGIRFFDMYHNSRITADLKVDTTTYMNDYLHPNSAGYDLLSPFIAEWMDTLSKEGNRTIITDLEISAPPAKTTYMIGETLDLSGGVLSYRLSTTKETDPPLTIPMTDERILIGEFDNTSVGRSTVTLQFMDLNVTLKLLVYAPALTSITIENPPAKTIYEQGEALDLSGLIVTAHYSNNTNTPVTDYEAEVDLSKAGEKEVIITYQGKTTSFKVTVLAALPFKDVKKTDWFYAGTLFCYRLGLMQGTSETAFSPNTQMTRAQIVTILYSRAGKPSIKGLANPFNDIKKTDWYYNATLWAADQGYVSGMGAGKFAPSGKLTRAQLVTILFAYVKKDGIANEKRDNLKSFKDKAEIPSWALEATQWAVANGVISGMNKNGKLCVSPNTTATRAQIAVIMKALFQ